MNKKRNILVMLVFVVIIASAFCVGCRINSGESNEAQSSKGWEKAYTECLKEYSTNAKDTVEFVLKDMSNCGVPNLIIKEQLNLTVYSYDGEVKELASENFKTGTTRFLYSDNAKYPGIFYFYESGGLNHYGYIASHDGKIKISELWNEDYSGISKELGEEREVIEELSSNKKLIKESERVYNENLDLAFTVVDSELLNDLENKINDYEIK